MASKEKTPTLTLSWVELAIEDYRAHRAEVLATVQGQHTTLGLGTAAVSVLAAAAFTVWDQESLATLILMGAVPLFSAFVLLIWIGQVAGMFQVGLYLKDLEEALRTIDPTAPAVVMSWEERIRQREGKRRSVRRWQNYGVIALFGAVAVGAIIVGASRLYGEYPIIVVAIAVTECLALVIFACALRTELDRGPEG